MTSAQKFVLTCHSFGSQASQKRMLARGKVESCTERALSVPPIASLCMLILGHNARACPWSLHQQQSLTQRPVKGGLSPPGPPSSSP